MLRAMLARTPAAQKKRRYRKRLRDGVIVLPLEVREHELVEALLVAGWLTEIQTTRREELTRAGENIVAEWCRRWRAKP
jgi:hypothetical protein